MQCIKNIVKKRWGEKKWVVIFRSQCPIKGLILCSKKLIKELTLLLWGRLSCFSFSTFLKTCTQFFLIGQSLVFLQTILFIYHLFTQKKEISVRFCPWWVLSLQRMSVSRWTLSLEEDQTSLDIGHQNNPSWDQYFFLEKYQTILVIGHQNNPNIGHGTLE